MGQSQDLHADARRYRALRDFLKEPNDETHQAIAIALEQLLPDNQASERPYSAEYIDEYSAEYIDECFDKVADVVEAMRSK